MLDRVLLSYALITYTQTTGGVMTNRVVEWVERQNVVVQLHFDRGR